MLEIDRVRKRRTQNGTERWVLDGVTLKVGEGIVYALLGESGTGKSTLLRCVSGLETFDEGDVRVGGVGLFANRRLQDAVRRRIGFVFQQHHLFAHMTAIENVMEAPVQVARLSIEDAKKRADKLLEQLGIAHRRDARPAELSGGEAQRVAIARAMAMEPTVLLLDEPTASLDPARRKGVTELLLDLAKGGTTLVVATHDLPFARDVASRAGMLENGSLVREGTVEEIAAP
jgi:polar amino acid transport system ATP-binding protein